MAASSCSPLFLIFVFLKLNFAGCRSHLHNRAATEVGSGASLPAPTYRRMCNVKRWLRQVGVVWKGLFWSGTYMIYYMHSVIQLIHPPDSSYRILYHIYMLHLYMVWVSALKLHNQMSTAGHALGLVSDHCEGLSFEFKVSSFQLGLYI